MVSKEQAARREGRAFNQGLKLISYKNKWVAKASKPSAMRYSHSNRSWETTSSTHNQTPTSARPKNRKIKKQNKNKLHQELETLAAATELA